MHQRGLHQPPRLFFWHCFAFTLTLRYSHFPLSYRSSGKMSISFQERKIKRNAEESRHTFLAATYYTVSFQSSKLFRLGGTLLWVVVTMVVAAVLVAIAAGLSSFCSCAAAAAARTASAAAWIAAGSSFCFCAAAVATEIAVAARRTTAAVAANLAVKDDISA